jgi:ATP-binding cassette subfamily F protein 3
VLTVSNLRKRYGPQTILDGTNWFVPRGKRVGLVGANGSGKSTLLRIIAGEVETDDGDVALPKATSVGYLSQEVFGLSGSTVLEQAMSAFSDIRDLADQCRRLELALADTAADDPRHQALMEEYTRLRSDWDTRGVYDMEAQAERVLTGLGFRPADLRRDCGEFSGGWQMRIALATLLLRCPQLLLLDEPTNHLDLEARNWLEEFLVEYPHTVIVVAHDRYFLDVVVQQISEVVHGKIVDYHTNYSRYLVEREERQQLQAEAYRLQQEEIERLQGFINRFRYQASKAALVQSRIKQMEKIERLQPPQGMRSVHFRFPQPPRSGRTVLELRAASKSFGSLSVYRDLDLRIERGRKIALVGPNGAGKSTLIKLLADTEPLNAGERIVGHNVGIGYFAQDQTQVLDPNLTVLEELTRVTPFDLVPQIRSILGSFLFSENAVHKNTSVLSGGERNRLALAKLLVHPSNCLLLDEPTNHLDIHAKEVLLDALLSYQGTLVFVAHDRYLLDRLPTEVIEVGAGTAVHHLGNYSEYLHWKATYDGHAPETPQPTPVPVEAPAKQQPDREQQRDERRAEQRRRRDEERRRKRIEELEAEIAAKEAELEELSSVINASDFYGNHENPHAVFSRYAALKEEVDALYTKLEKLEGGATSSTAAC